MATPVLIIGKSGSGKSTSMRNCVGKEDWNVIRVLNKPFPFKGKINGWVSDDYQTVMKALYQSKAKNIVIDDAGYLITNMFMKGHSNAGAGNAVFSFYNTMNRYINGGAVNNQTTVGDSFWQLINFIVEKLPEDKIVYVVMHEDKNDFGDIKAKTIGKIIDEKVCLEGMFTIVLRCKEESGKHLFVTQCAEGAISKSPLGMFEDLTIDNDLLLVEKAIREYYEI